MTAPASLGLSLLLLAASLSPAVAAAPAPAEAGTRPFVYFVGGQSIGSERFDVENRGDTLLVSGELVLNQPMERRLRATTRVAGPDEHFVSYLLRTTRGDSLGASVFGDSLHLFAIGPSFNRESNVAAGEDPRLAVMVQEIMPSTAEAGKAQVTLVVIGFGLAMEGHIVRPDVSVSASKPPTT